MKKQIEKIKILFETLPYIRKFAGTTVVIKFGGHAMVSEQLKSLFAEDIVFLKYLGINPVVVHGGGPQIGAMMERLGLKPRFIDGHRFTDEATMDIVEMVLAGKINKDIVASIQRAGGKAVGLSGKDGFLLQARRKKLKVARAGVEEPELVDIGLVGEVTAVDPDVVRALEEWDFIPVISPIGADLEGHTYNLNADTAAAAVAAALKAQKLVFLTDAEGVLDKDGALLPTLDREKVGKLIRKGVITGGMIPKVNYCLQALEGGVRQTHVIDGRLEHAILLEMFTESGIGTEILEA
jgi:acetylglutamate kinase